MDRSTKWVLDQIADSKHFNLIRSTGSSIFYLLLLRERTPSFLKFRSCWWLPFLRIFPLSSCTEFFFACAVTWNVTCTYSQFLAQRAPSCCVSFSAFYDDTIVPCPTCSCACLTNSTTPIITTPKTLTNSQTCVDPWAPNSLFEKLYSLEVDLQGFLWARFLASCVVVNLMTKFSCFIFQEHAIQWDTCNSQPCRHGCQHARCFVLHPGYVSCENPLACLHQLWGVLACEAYRHEPRLLQELHRLECGCPASQFWQLHRGFQLLLQALESIWKLHQ